MKPWEGIGSWTDERTELAKKLWREGLSASQIAKQLGGVTRNGVIGKLTRAGLTRSEQAKKAGASLGVVNREKRHAPSPPKAAPPKLAIAANGAVYQTAPAKASPVNARAFAPLPSVSPVPFMDTRTSHCRWPVGGEGASMLCCGAAAIGGPYCPTHTRRASPAPSAKAYLDRKLGIAEPGRAA